MSVKLFNSGLLLGQHLTVLTTKVTEVLWKGRGYNNGTDFKDAERGL